MNKKLFNQGTVLFIVGIVAGAFYREFTKFMSFTGVTSMSLVHTHLIATGALVAIIFSIFIKVYDIKDTPALKRSWNLYFIGVIGNAAIMFIRGIFTVMNVELSRAASMSISGIAGIIHILLTVGIIWFLLTLKKEIKA